MAKNGRKTATARKRDAQGRFRKGAPGGPGRPRKQRAEKPARPAAPAARQPDFSARVRAAMMRADAVIDELKALLAEAECDE